MVDALLVKSVSCKKCKVVSVCAKTMQTTNILAQLMARMKKDKVTDNYIALIEEIVYGALAINCEYFTPDYGEAVKEVVYVPKTPDNTPQMPIAKPPVSEVALNQDETQPGEETKTEEPVNHEVKLVETIPVDANPAMGESLTCDIICPHGVDLTVEGCPRCNEI